MYVQSSLPAKPKSSVSDGCDYYVTRHTCAHRSDGRVKHTSLMQQDDPTPLHVAMTCHGRDVNHVCHVTFLTSHIIRLWIVCMREIKGDTHCTSACVLVHVRMGREGSAHACRYYMVRVSIRTRYDAFPVSSPSFARSAYTVSPSLHMAAAYIYHPRVAARRIT